MVPLLELFTPHLADPLQEPFLGTLLLTQAGLFMGPLTEVGTLTGPTSAAPPASSPASLVALAVVGPGWCRWPFLRCMVILSPAALLGSPAPEFHSGP